MRSVSKGGGRRRRSFSYRSLVALGFAVVGGPMLLACGGSSTEDIAADTARMCNVAARASIAHDDFQRTTDTATIEQYLDYLRAANDRQADMASLAPPEIKTQFERIVEVANDLIGAVSEAQSRFGLTTMNDLGDVLKENGYGSDPATVFILVDGDEEKALEFQTLARSYARATASLCR